MLDERLRGAGAQHGSDAAPLCVSKEWLLTDCERQERILKIQVDELALTEEDAGRIATLRRAAEADSTPTGALRLWKVLGHFYMVREDGLVRRAANGGTSAEQASHDLLHRRTVDVVLENGRRVRVGGRSYSALLLIAAHGARAQLLETEMEHLQAKFAQAHTEARRHLRFTKIGRRWRVRLRAIERRHGRVALEAARQRITMWAHALTTSGAPHPAGTSVPAWLHEITQTDEVALFDALHEVGPRRIAALMAALPKPKPRPRRGATPAAERPDFGPDGLLTAYGYRLKVPAAECYDVDLGYLAAELMTTVQDLGEEMSN
jgi:hypothetical protein